MPENYQRPGCTVAYSWGLGFKVSKLDCKISYKGCKKSDGKGVAINAYTHLNTFLHCIV